jgi:hypothetical protein
MAETLTRELQRTTSGFDKLPLTQEGIAQCVDYYLSEDHRDDCGGGCAVAALRRIQKCRPLPTFYVRSAGMDWKATESPESCQSVTDRTAELTTDYSTRDNCFRLIVLEKAFSSR